MSSVLQALWKHVLIHPLVCPCPDSVSFEKLAFLRSPTPHPKACLAHLEGILAEVLLAGKNFISIYSNIIPKCRHFSLII